MRLRLIKMNKLDHFEVQPLLANHLYDKHIFIYITANLIFMVCVFDTQRSIYLSLNLFQVNIKGYISQLLVFTKQNPFPLFSLESWTALPTIPMFAKPKHSSLSWTTLPTTPQFPPNI